MRKKPARGEGGRTGGPWGVLAGGLVLCLAASVLVGGQRLFAQGSAAGVVAEPLWPGGAPGALGSAPEDQPTLMAFLPTANPTHTAVVIAPGGGYAHLSMAKEGTDVAAWLTRHGVAAFVLQYRLGPRYHYPVELEDAQRAIRTVRSRAAKYGVDPARVGMWGFSAGGHLTATAGTHFDDGKPGSADPVERVGSRPDFLILAYPVITLKDPEAHKGSRLYLLGETPAPALVESLSAETQVTARTPPTFLFATTDDAVVPVMNSVLFYGALVRAGVSAEMHLFQHGPHGVGLAQADPDLRAWPGLLLTWMRARGLAAPTDPQ